MSNYFINPCPGGKIPLVTRLFSPAPGLAGVLCAFMLLSAVHCHKKQSNEPAAKGKSTISRLHTDGRWIVDDKNEKTILRGVNIASMEWNSSGENMLQSLQVVADDWHGNLVRVPLSQDRWFGKAPEQRDEGRAYRALVSALVRLGGKKGVYLLLELHWNNANVWGQYIGQHKMPDANSRVFFEDLAATYANHPAVLLGLYNEPHDVSWDIWREGGAVTEQSTSGGTNTTLKYDAIGFQALYDAVRAAGATQNLIVIGGLDWGFDLTGILQGHAITGENIVYDTHPYPWKDSNWDNKFGNTGKQYPILVGEWGGDPTMEHQSYGARMADYLRDNKFCWTAWCFHPSAGPTLIVNWDYEPTWFGRLVMQELAKPVEVDQ